MSRERLMPEPVFLSSRLAARLVAFCARRAWLTLAAGLVISALALAHIALGGFKMTTDSDALLSPQLPYRQAELAFRELFPSARAEMLVVIDASTSELAEATAQQLSTSMAQNEALFRNVRRAEPEFLMRSGLMYLPVEEVATRTDQLVRAAPFLGPLAEDPTLRGVANVFGSFATGVTRGDARLSDIDRAVSALQPPLDSALTGQPQPFSWRNLFSDEPPGPRELRKLILADPVKTPGKLRASARAAEFVRAQAATLGFTPENGVTVRLTGPGPLADEEFATLAENIWLTGLIGVLAIVAMVWLAVRSIRASVAILLTTAAGLLLTMSAGLLLFGRFNAISVAFIPLFVGLGIDFCIQMGVRLRSEQQQEPDLDRALIGAAGAMGRSLVLAAAAISVGFLAFVPTAYVGVSQLGAIAGVGMLVALLLSLTLLPALLRVLPPAGALPSEDLKGLGALDEMVTKRRRTVLAAAGAAALLGVALAPLLRFDFNPLNLRSAKTESVSTLLDLSRDPAQSPDSLNFAANSLAEAQALAQRLEALPEVDRVILLSRFVPAGQDEKLPLIEDAAFLLGPTLDPFELAPTPTDEETSAALRDTSVRLRDAAMVEGGEPQAVARAQQLADTLDALAAAEPAARERADYALTFPLAVTLSQVRTSLQAEAISLDTLPPDFARQWLGPQGRARLSIVPEGDTNDPQVRQRFVEAVRGIAPAATGAPVAQFEAGRLIVGAFTLAGVLSFAAILVLLFVVLRRPLDVIATVAPIGLTALLTLATTVLIGLPLNFANIIALPLLFGMGVAYHIYFVMAWRAGEPHALNSSLARAVLFSALTSATGFGSLWLSSHPGTSSMGQLLLISLLWTLVSALIFQPALMRAILKRA